jgi:hypothetical protein
VGDALLGFGEYKVSPSVEHTPGQAKLHKKLFPSAEQIAAGQQPPVAANAGEGVILGHVEFLTDVVIPKSTAGKTVVKTYDVQLGDDRTFPWGARQSEGWQEYKLLQAVFKYESRASPVNNATAQGIGIGQVVLATQYDPTKSNFDSVKEALNSGYASSGKPSDSFFHGVECDPKQTPFNLFYVDPVVEADQKDTRTTTLGRFHVIAEGIPDSDEDQVIGTLRVTYAVEFEKQVLPDPSSHWWFHIPAFTSTGDSHALYDPTDDDLLPILMPGSKLDPGFVFSEGHNLRFPKSSEGDCFFVVWQPHLVTQAAPEAFFAEMDIGLGGFEAINVFPNPADLTEFYSGTWGIQVSEGKAATTQSVAGGALNAFRVKRGSTDEERTLQFFFTLGYAGINYANLWLFRLPGATKAQLPLLSLRKLLVRMNKALAKQLNGTTPRGVGIVAPRNPPNTPCGDAVVVSGFYDVVPPVRVKLEQPKDKRNEKQKDEKKGV